MFFNIQKEISLYKDKPDEVVLLESQKKPYLFEILVDKYFKIFKKRAMLYTKDWVLAEDIAQEVFVKIYQKADTFKKQEGASFSSWAYAILRNTAINEVNKLYGRQDKVIAFSTLSELSGQEENDHDILDIYDDGSFAKEMKHKEDLSIIENLKARLPEKFARFLHLSMIEGKNYKEIAEAERVSESAIKLRMFRLRAMVKEMDINI